MAHAKRQTRCPENLLERPTYSTWWSRRAPRGVAQYVQEYETCLKHICSCYAGAKCTTASQANSNIKSHQKHFDIFGSGDSSPSSARASSGAAGAPVSGLI